MTHLADLFPSWTQALGWSLLNSLWQGLAIMLLIALILRIIPSRLSQLRYALSCGALLTVLAINVATLFYILQDHSPASGITQFTPNQTLEMVPITFTPTVERAFGNVLMMIEVNMPLIILSWIIGTLIFSLRMLSGWWYVSKLRSEAVILKDAWSERLQDLARQLHIDRAITLAQSSKIDTPVVMGLLKPIILVPVGMFSGLTTAQIESIFIHELAHIRRHDYLINLIQSFVETIFFFNPFIWIISNIIRREREFCCDDTVITKHGNALAYAHALTQLEEVRLSKSAFVLSLAADKNQLLNRIKRIMEKSVKNYSGKDRLIPALLLVIGLICASWLTIKSDRKTENAIAADRMIQDTTIREKEKSARSSRTTIITFDEKGEPHEEIIEEYSGSEDLRPMMAFSPDATWDAVSPAWAVPPIPSADFIPPSLAEMMDASAFPSFEMFDTIPGRAFRYRSEGEWKAFSEEFEKRFKEKFGDFYKSHEVEMEKMMKELEEKFSEHFQSDDWAMLEANALTQNDLERVQAEQIEAEQLARLAQEDLSKQMQELQVINELNARQMHNEMREQELVAMAMMEDAKAIEANMKRFEKALTTELVADGYVSKGEELKTIDWDDDGGLKINGKQIKESDREKYRKLRKKYLGNDRHFHIVE